MTTPHDSNRVTNPSVREIAALAARLRELSARGRDADPAAPVVTFDESGFYSDADIAAISDVLAAGDAERARRLQDRPRTGPDSEVDPGVVARVEARFLMDGDRFTHDGRVHVVDDVPIAHDDVLTVPTRAGDDATWVDLPAGQWVTLSDPSPGPVLPDWVREQARRGEVQLVEQPAAMVSPDDPVVVAERVGQLRAAHGPRHLEEPLTRADAAERLVERGYDRAGAQEMVTGYLHETSRAVGAPVHLWGLDQSDVDAIAADHRWVDHQRGETLGQARERAVGHAAGWTERAATVDRDHSPGYASHAERQAARWSERASTPEPFTHPDATAAEDPQQLADRVAALYDRVAAQEPDPGSDDAAGVPARHAGLADAEPEQRREQLLRWHHDDHEPADGRAHQAGDGHGGGFLAGEGDGQVWVCDDAPGLP